MIQHHLLNRWANGVVTAKGLSMLIRTGLGGQLSGSTGGVTASRNRYGQYLRNRTVPVNPNTPRQQAVRSAFASGAILWQGLSNTQREQWRAYAATTPTLNKLGETVYLTGNAAFLAAYQWFAASGNDASWVETAPVTPGMSSWGSGLDTELQLSVATGFGALDGSAGLTATMMAVSIGPPLSPGAEYPGTKFSFFGTDAIDQAIAAPSPVPFGSLVVGQRRPIRLSGVDNGNKLAPVVTRILTVVA